jgi:hypothetical protein
MSVIADFDNNHDRFSYQYGDRPNHSILPRRGSVFSSFAQRWPRTLFSLISYLELLLRAGFGWCRA